MPSSATDLSRDAASVAPGDQAAGFRSGLAATGMLIYAAIRVFGLAVTAFLLRRGRFRHIHYSLVHLIVSWDSSRYVRIATHWYVFPTTYRYPDSILCWFPGYPLAIDTIRWIPGVGPERAGFAITVAAGLAAAWGLTRLGMALTGDRRLSLVMVAVWAVAPASIVLSMLYSEALLCALAIWALVALTERRWLTAAGLAIGAGLVHSTGIAVVAAVIVGALGAVIPALRARQPVGTWWRPAAAVALSPLGTVSYWAYTVERVHHIGGWAWLEHNGHNGFDWGQGVFRALRIALFGQPWATLLLTLGVLAAAVVLTAYSLTERFPLSMHVYTLAVVVMALGTGPFYLTSKPRFLLPAVLLSVPVARRLAPLPPWVLGLVIGVLCAASVWFSLFLISANCAP
jgi:Mannosyltransferase (PIG-V)